MNLLYQVKCGDKIYPVGEYKGGLPKDVEKDLKEKGYFETPKAKAKAEK